MSSCPFCQADLQGYRIVGLPAADAGSTGWLAEPVPVAMLFCRDCGRITFMHPDHPCVQRLAPEPPVETSAENVRTLNVAVEEVADPTLRQQFEAGQPE